MRLIGIGLLAFLLAGVVLLFSTLDVWQNGRRFVDEIIVGPQLVFETRDAANGAGDITASIVRADQDQPLLLSGLPSYQSAEFFLPSGVRPAAGILQIDATFQVLDGVEGVLRISIDNARRGEVILRPGEVFRSLRITLSPSDLVREKLVVSFSLQGEGQNQTCNDDKGLEAVVEIEATSAVILKLDQPLMTARDSINSWGRVVRVAWPHWLDPDEGLRRLLLAADFKRVGFDAAFIDDQNIDAFSTAQLREAKLELSPTPSGSDAETWPAFLAGSGPNAGLRRFYRTTNWRERYDLRDTPQNTVPMRLDLSVMLGPQYGGADWLLSVTLNNRLVFHDSIEASGGKYTAAVNLPTEMQNAVNVIEVTATSTQSDIGECNRGPEFLAELLPDTVLVAGEEIYSDALTRLRAELSKAQSVTVGFTSMPSAVDASIASDLLAQLVPQSVAFKPGFGNARILVLPPRIEPIEPPLENSYVAFFDPQSQMLQVEPFDSASGAHRRSVSLLVFAEPRPIQVEGK